MLQAPTRFRIPHAAEALLLFAVCGCAHIEKGAYGVRNVEIEGADEMGASALATCLLTEERPEVGLTLGLTPKECGEPPFERDPPHVGLWRWPWTDWQSFNPAVLEHDTERVLRWYRARGFYDARVKEIRYEPPAAAEYVGKAPPGECDPEREECPVDITVVVEEGEPLRIRSVRVLGAPDTPELDDARDELPEKDERFDEYDYDAGKQALLKGLHEACFADGKVEGEVRLDHLTKTAEITYRVERGAKYSFGDVSVEGHGALSAERIARAARVEPGSEYHESTLQEVQRAIYALGAFSAVEVTQKLDPPKRRVHLIVKVTPLPKHAGRVGAGITNGALRRTETGELASVPQWDVHLFGRYEHRHLFDTLGKISIEDRPRVIFQEPFPGLTPPRPGNIIKAIANQPALIEARTDLIATGQWDFGPDPYLGFERHDILARLSGRRAFFTQRLLATLSVQQDFYIVSTGQTTTDGSELPVGYGYSFLEQDLRLDLRDDPTWTRKGLYVGMLASEAPRWATSDWTAFRVLPELRAYLPLPFHMVLAGRFAVGAIFIADADPECDPAAGITSECLDATSRELGPTAYRLRGGGATSNRGFPAGRLGAGLVGGLRRWEATLELRIRLGESLALVLFGDLGDVNRVAVFRFDEPNPSVGFGLRYLTPIGAIRFDAGFRVGPTPADAALIPLLDNVPGAIHLTLGEAF